jgi:phosphohistidine phosphatase
MHELALRLALQGQASPILTNKLRGRFPTSTVVVFGWGAGGPTLEHLLFASENGGAGGE